MIVIIINHCAALIHVVLFEPTFQAKFIYNNKVIYKFHKNIVAILCVDALVQIYGFP